MEAERSKLILRPDPSRVLFRPFDPSNGERAARIVARVLALEESEAKRLASRFLLDFEERHHGLIDYIRRRFEHMKRWLISDEQLSDERKLLVGAYFIQEYALEAAALFNPSIVPHPDQSGLGDGELRFVMSLRATGEGHISSLAFREGVISAAGKIRVETASPIALTGDVEENPEYDKELFARKLKELGIAGAWTMEILDELPGPTFRLDRLDRELRARLEGNRFISTAEKESADGIRFLSHANYKVRFDPKRSLSERVLFPYSPSELKGIEDARFVAFNEKGKRRYIATYTAFNGGAFVPQMIETDDFCHFSMSTLNGPEALNKGMALFPRRIGGRYAMISRQDNENVFLMYSDMLHFWYEKQLLMRPTYDWEFVQLGNCGSPIETEKGWLLITHGVGNMRLYSIGAALLDLEDPSRVIARSRKPILTPIESERGGYVPNVVYSCGSLVHGSRLIMPYALSDQCSSFATFDLEELLASLSPV